MKKPTTLKSILVVLFFIQSFVVFAQKNFTPRFDQSLKGDMLLIGNNILNRDIRNGERPNNAFNATDKNNNDLDMQYVDVDSDNTTFSSSSANLVIPTASRECYKIVYAGLYWAGIYSKGAVDNGTVNRANLGSIKFKLPGQTTYNNITGSLIYDYYPTTSNGDQMPYAYYYDATSLVQGLTNPEGTYTAANIIAARGTINGGYSAGWNLFVVYEDPKSSAKYITTFDGFRWIQASSGPVTYDISGFKTIPVGGVKAKLAFAALEGDVNLTGDRYSINGTDISTTERLVNNFFNSTFNDTSGPYTNRNPASGNTLGFEAGILNVPNPATGAFPGGSVIKNNDTSAQLKLTTSGDGYGLFFNAFNVEIIEPKIVLTKIVKNESGVNIGGQDVTLGQKLNYEIGFENTGNDDATSFTIRDQLPINIIFNYPADLNTLPTGVTVQSYNPATRNIVFNIANSLVRSGLNKKNTVISFKVQVVPDCSMLSEACSNSIDNSAYATYKGITNSTFTISDDPSVNTNTGCILVPKATNFLVGVDGCKFSSNVTLCTDDVDLVAANGYTNYTWYSDAAHTVQIGTGQTLNVKNPGTYYVYNLAAAPCRSIYQEFVVTRFGTTATNPVIPFADQVVTCPDTGKPLPNIFLCGNNASKLIKTNITESTSSIVWERLDTAICPSNNKLCPNEDKDCTGWVQVANGPDYAANTAGQYRLTINYTGACFNRFYFNVYENKLNATETHTDIICSKNGNITVGGVPSGYEYAISADPNGPIGAYQSSNIFPITTAGYYTIHIRQVGVTTNPCDFTIPGIQIRKRDLTITKNVVNANCNGDKGSIAVVANNVDAQYYYRIYNGATLVNSFGPTADNNYIFPNLNPGITYTIEVYSGNITIAGNTVTSDCKIVDTQALLAAPAAITATAALTVPLTSCSDGKIVITPTGGTAPYFYFINGSTTFQTSNEIIVTTPGKFDIQVVDSKNCTATTSITVTANPKPVYTVTKTDINCSGDKTQITVNVTNANGYTLEYSINGGAFTTNPVFTNLSGGTYSIVVRYTLSGTTCTDPAVPVTITEPANALSASAGVSELAGCDPSGNGFGKVRITNPQGGTPPYTYSFDGGNVYGPSNEAYIAPGTYTLYVKDSKGCVYSMPGVVLDPKPADPTIAVGAPVFNCNGTATSTVTVTNGGGANYSYEYYLDNVLNTNTPPNVFLNVPSGSHTVSVKYNLVSVPTYSNLLLENFGSGGTTTSPGIAAAYCFNDQRVNPPYTCSLNGTPTRSVEDNQYSVASFFWRNDTAWYQFKDHTTNGADANGRYLLVNIGSAAGPYGILYSKPIIDVIPNQPVMVDLYVANLLNTGQSGAAPIVRFELVNSAGVVVATQDTGKIAEAANDPNRTKWVPINLSLNPGNNTNLTFRIRSGSTDYGGNDLVIDDIWVRQIPKSCISQKDFPIVIDSNKAFSASITGFKDLTCAGSNNGEITIAAQNFNLPYGFDYSLDNGVTWVNSKVSPVTATGLSDKTYAIRVRFDSSASSCVFPFSQVIKAPSALTVTAQVTAQPTCTNGASITATATGGTPNYQYELRQLNGVTVVVPFQTSNVFTNIATGSYTVVARDANSCSSPASVRVDINAPNLPTASLAATSDLCYDTTNQSTLVVTATGSGTLTYSLDGAPAQTSNTFTNVGPGTHSVVVTDSNNCTATVSNIVIAPELKGSAAISKTLDCTTSPNASITVTITGGTSAFTYKVRRGTGAYGSSIPVTGTSFVYTATTAGTYTFQITDSKGCVTTVSGTISPISNPTVTANPTQITCNGLTNGSVQLIGAGGSGGYEYNFNNAGWSSTSLYSNLSPNIDYTYLVRDSKGCTSASATIRLTQPTAVSGTISATELQCNGTGTTPAVVTVNGAGGTGAYTYSFNGTTNFTSTNTFSTSTGGAVTAYIRDANNCQFGPLSVTIAPLDRITGITITDSGYDCSTTPPGGHVNIAAVKTDISAPIRFQIISGPAGYNSASNSDGEFKSLAPGNYVFQATDIKSGCSFTVPYTVKGAPDIVAAGSSLTNIQCNGATGTLQFTVNGVKNRGYDYVITNAGGTIIQQQNNVSETTTVINVTAPQPAGTYTITATDRLTKCQSTFSITLTQPNSLVSFTATATNVNCNNDNSQITVTATGGTPNYTYAFAKSPSTVPSSAYGNSATLTVDTNSGADLVWDVYVKDVNGCTTKRTVTIVNDNLPTVTATNNNQCTGSGNSFTITATGTGLAPLTYSIDGTNFQASNVFNVTAGTYTVTVKDKNGCTASTAAALVIYPQLTAVGSVTKELDCSVSPNATITVTITGGKGPFTYTSRKGAGATSAPSASIAGPTFTFSVTPANADTYTFVITDANGCQTTAVTKVDPITNPTVTAVPVNASCNGALDGSVTLTGAGGSGGFTYSNNATSGFTTNPVFTGLAAGSYTYYVKDSKGCTGSVAVVIGQPTTLAVTVTAVPFSCNASNAKVAGTVTINVTAGTGTSPYQYSFNGGGFGSNNVLTLNDNGADQPYTYAVRDAKGCPVTGSGTLLRLNPPTDLTFASPAVTCNATTTTVTLTAVNGVGTLRYETIAPSVVIIPKQTSNAFANLAPGTYTFRVTDANGCYYTEAYVVNPVTPIAVVGNKTSDVLCKGGNTGSGTYTVSGNATVGAYTYTLSPNTATITKAGNVLTLTNAAVGTYTITVTDTATGCTNSAGITIGEPAVALGITSAVATNVYCNNDNSQITITATGGTPNYTYAFAKSPSAVPSSAYGNSNILTVDTNSGADLVWDVYVKDANGCIAKSTATVILDAMPSVTATVNNQCTGSASTFTITATGTGLAPLTYGINGPTGAFQSSNTFTVATGTYTVYVKDKNGCIASAPAATIVYPQLTVAGTVTKELDCSATPNATITVTIGGGRAQFTYTVQKGAGAPSASSAPIAGPTFTYSVTPANADTYRFVITDANGCTKTAVVTVDPITNPTVTAIQTNASCNGALDGSVTLTGAGGSGNFTYSNNATTGFTTNPTFTGLAAGAYTFYVKDSKGCVGSVAVTITQPITLAATAVTVPFSCNTSNGKVAGTVTVNVTAGTGTLPYQYSFNGGGFGSNNVLTLNDNGADQPYTYTVKDAKGCTVSGSGTLLRLNPPTDLTFAAPNVTCLVTTTTVTLTAVNGVGTLQYETIAPSPVIVAKQTSNTFANLAPGTYMFKVTDANGCYYTESYTIQPVTPITVLGNKLSDVLCNGGNTGSIRYTVSGFGTTYRYTINGGTAVTAQSSPTINLTNLVAGPYAIVVTDEVTGCTANASITISQPAAALSATYATVNANCFVSTSEVTVTAAGGTPVYRYSFVLDGSPAGTYSNSNKANLDPIAGLNWDVHVIDANGCTFKLDVTITRDAVPTVTASATGQCFGVGTYTITATPGVGLVAPLSYSINNGASYQAGNTFTITTPGTYTVRIKDGNGCTANSNVVIVDSMLGLTAVLDKNITCSIPTAAQVTLTANGGTAPYTYESKESGVYTAMASNVFNTMAAGSYTFRVTDSRGCTFETTTPIIITTPVNPNITNVVQTQFISCHGDTNAAISITIDNTLGQAPFVYNVFNNTTSVDYGTQTSGLTAGDYIITVTDAKGCKDTFLINIAEPAAILVAHHAVPITCSGGGVSKGSVIVDSVSGGVGPYNYFVTGVNGYNQSELNNLGTTSVSFNVVDFGIYQINVVDSNGCSVLIQNVLVASPPDDLDITVISPPADCSSLGSAVVAIGSSSTNITGNGPFHFAVYTGPGMTYTAPTALPWYDEDVLGTPGSKKTTIPNLLPGVKYTFIVHDAGTGCYYYETAEFAIPTNSTLTTSALVANNVTCKGSANGNVSFTITSIYPSATPVSYEIFNSQTLVTTGITGTGSVPANGTLNVTNFGPLPFGNYIVVVKETAGATHAGCSIATAPFNITESAIDLSITASVSKKANCNPNSGVITAIAKDGTAPYTYQLLLATDPAPTAASAGWAAANTFNRNAGNYIAYVKDAYGCIKPASITLGRDADPTITAPVAICYDGNPFTIAISGTVDPAIVGGATYSVNGSSFQTSPNFTFNAPGVYNLVIKDGNGCTATSTYEVKPQLLLNAALTKELDCTPTPNATITLTATGGYNSLYTYEYSVNGGGFTTMLSNTLSTSVLGNYVFRVTDAKLPLPSCQATATLTLDPLPATVFTTAQTAVKCFGGSDGTITVNVTSGVGPYQYQLDGGTFQTSNVFTGLAAGSSYIITVRDNKSCDFPSAPITIGQPTALTATSVLTTPLTCATGNVPTKALVTVTAANGTPNYLYSFDNGVTYTSTNTYEAFAGTTFNVLVKDANGCIFTLVNGVDIPALNPPTITNITGTPIYCNPAASTTSTVTITTTNGVGTLAYAILSPASATTNVSGASSGIFTLLAPATYLFEVTDDNGCKDQKSYTVAPVTNITVSGALVSDVTCNGSGNGAVKFTVANYAGGYTAALIAGTGTLAQTGNTVNVTALVPGTYTVEVTDAITGCTAQASVVVAQPPVLNVSAVSINANCNFGAKVSATATGGTPNYVYAFVQDGVTPVAGNYTSNANAVLSPTVNTQWDVYVKDANGCTAKYDLTIATDPLPTINSSAGLYCYTGGPVPITITGTYVGVPTYSIGNGYQASPNFVLNAPGNYTFYIKDGNGCIVSSPYKLNQELLLKATLTKDLDCTGAATITLLATQGTLTYAGFEVDFNGGGYTAATSPYTATAPGTYTFRVTDSQGCQSLSMPVIVSPVTTPTATFTQTNVSCIGGNDGSIIVTPADGVLPYQYSINGGTFQTSNIFTGLVAGTYNIVVRDAKQCTSVIVTATITQPAALAATAVLTQSLTCGTGNATQPAVITVNVTAGTGTAPYQYSFNGGSNYSSTNTFTTFNAGTVTVYVKDANNCTIATPVDVVVPALDPPTIDTITGTPIWCTPAANTTSTVTIAVSNGVAPLHYEILSPASAVGNNSGASSGVFTGLSADTYLFQVTDANGCKDDAYYTVDPLANITIAGLLVNDVSCNGGADGSVKFDIDKVTGAYTATLIGGPTTGTLTQTGKVVTLTNLTIGTYTVEVVDTTTGCRASTSVTVGQPSALTLTSTSINANCNTGAQVSVTAAGGTPNYKYAFVVSGTTPTATDYTNSNTAVLDQAVSLNWDAYVLDSKGCETFIPIVIAVDPLPTAITAVVASQCPSATGEFTFTVSVGSGMAPYEYSIGNGFQSSPTFTVPSGTYDVTVRDANGCEATATAAVNIAPALQLDAVVTALPSCTANNGIITATATGGSGTANYEYTLDGGVTFTATPTVFNNVAPGTHIIRVRDIATTCTFDVTVEIAPATIITGLTLTGKNVSCKGFADGSITTNLAPNGAGVNDNPVYTYTLTGTTVLGVAVNRPAQTLNVFDNLEAGDYSVTVTSGRGCVDSEDIRILEPQPIVVAAPVIAQYGCASGTNTSNYATITVSTVTGGSGNYITYEFLKNGVVVQTGSSNVYSESNFLGGNYTVNVYDDNGCVGSTAAPVTIDPFISLDAVNVAVNTAVTCISNEDITVSVTSTGGTPVLLNYTVTGMNGNTYNQTNTNGVFTGLIIGDYLIKVENPATGCTIEKIHYVNDPNTFEIKAVTANGKICFGTTDGSVDLTFVDNQLVPTNDAGAFDYTITGPLTLTGTTTNAGPFNIANLIAGQYTVVAKLVNNPECTVTTLFTIEQPAAALTVVATKSDITCITGNNDGIITAVATGGWDSKYQYQLVLAGTTLIDYSDQSVFSGLSAGVYTINVKDGNDCIATTTATLVVPAPIVITTSPDVMLTCFGDTSGTITVTNVTGGQGSNYLYTLNVVSANPVISSGPQASPVFTDLGAGTYTVTVTDGFNCSATSGNIIIDQPTEVKATLVKSKGLACTTLAQLTLSATGGSAPYTYSADANFATVIGSFTTPVTFDVSAGSYKYYVKDAQGCVSIVSNDINVDPLEQLTLTLDRTNAVVKCTGDDSAVIVATATGGLGSYQYTLYDNNGNILAGPQPEDRFENLVAGTYSVKVDSEDCSQTSAAIIIGQPATPFTATVTVTPVYCFGEKTGRIEVVGAGGTGAYVYSISPRSDQYFDTGVFDKLEVGTYIILANDQNGCPFMQEVEVTGPATPLFVGVTPGSIHGEECLNDSNGGFTIDIAGGTAPYTVSLDDKNGTYETVTVIPHPFDNIKGGTHTVYLKDANGCTFEISVDVPLPVDLTSEVNVVYGCETNTVTVTVLDTTIDPADIDYALDNGTYQAENEFKDVVPGPHKIFVRHTNACILETQEFTIEGFAKLELNIVSAGVTEMNVIEVKGVGGKPDYLYSFNGEPFTSDNKYKIYKSGDYTVIVRDQNGCEVTIVVPMVYVDVCIPDHFTPNGDGQFDEWGPGCTNIYNNLIFEIFDRYGRVIAKYRYGQKWDGKYNGAELPTGDYWYVLKLNDEKDAREFVGHFTLYR